MKLTSIKFADLSYNQFSFYSCFILEYFLLVFWKILINWVKQSIYKPIPFIIHLLTWHCFHQNILLILGNCQLHCKKYAFPNSNFSLKIWNSSLQPILSVTSLKWQVHFINFLINICQTCLNNYTVSVTCVFKKELHYRNT